MYPSVLELASAGARTDGPNANQQLPHADRARHPRLLRHRSGLGGKVGMVGYESIALPLFSKQVAWSHWCLGDSISARWNGFSIRLPMDDRR